MPDSDLNSLLKGAPAANKAPELRSFTDYPTIRKNILDNVMSAVTSKFPLQNARYRIDLEQPAYARTDDYSLREQQEAIMQQQSLYMPLRGQLTMRDIATNQVIDKTDGPVTLARVPYLTNRGTFINSGSEYTVANQSRLLAGPYVRRRKSGEYEAHFNTNPGKGRGFRMVFMPDTGKFVMEIGQSMSPAYPALRALGVDDTTIAKVWGQRLADINKQHSAYDAARLYERLTNNPTSGMDEAAIYAGIKEALEKTELDPAVTRRTLGGSTAKLGSVPMRGTMRIESEGYVTVPQEFVDSVFYALRDSDKATAISPVNDKGRLVVLDSDELKGLRKVYKHDFEATVGSGRRFTYNLADVLPDPSIEGTWFVKVDSPELQQFRRSLGLPQVPTGGFRIHVGDKVNTSKLEDLMSKSAAGKSLVGGHDSFLKDPLPLDDNSYGRITGQTMLRASQKILNAQNGFEDTDDRDALSYQKFYGPEDYFPERIEKDAGGVLRSALFKATNRGNLAPFRSSVFTPILNGVLIGSGLAAPIEEVNPIDILDQNMRLIRTGEGGISSSAHGVPRDTRSVQPSHFGIVDPVRTPESGSVGIDLRLTIGALKGRDGQIYSKLRNIKTGKLEPVSASGMSDAIVAFPGELERAKRTGDPVRAMKAGHISYVSPEEVQYELPSYANMFNINSNLVPGISGLKGGRLLMGSKYFTQALPVQGGEAPLVQALDPSDPEGKSFEAGVSQHLGAVHSKADLGPGLVTDVTGDQITVKHGKTKQTYELYNNFPYNRKSYVHNTPLVKVGDQVKPGQLLAKSNYTDDQGNLAMGRNLRVAYMVWGDPEHGGANFEDGVVMSESAAKKMSAEHMYLVGYDSKDDFKADKSKYISLFPGQYKADQLQNIDDRGVVKVGTVLNEGDPMILGVGERQGDTFGLMKKSRPTFMNRVQAWDHASPGVVTAVTKTRGGYQIAVKAYKPMEIGDKLVGRYGDKGVISTIVPDDQMPKNDAGDPYEVLYNPLGLITRVNPVQAVEAVLGKVAAKNGKPVMLPAFMDESFIDHAMRVMRENKVSDTDTVYDPQLGKKIPGVFSGVRYFMNLHHQAEGKLTGRDTGAYSVDEAPLKGGDEGAKRIGIADINAMLAHGAVDVLKDARLIRGQKNDEYWRAVKMGQPVPAVNVPFVWDKFVSQLRGAGVNVTRQGGAINIYGMTGKDVKALSGGEVKQPKDIDFRTGEAYKDGFFDERIFGANQSHFGHFPLAMPIINPVMEDVVRSLTGLTQKDFEAVVSGESVKGVNGMPGLMDRLKAMDIPKEIDKAKQEIANSRGQRRSNAITRLSYLDGMAKRNVRPEDFVWTDMPVLPPRFRPITDTGSMQMVSDINYLYKELFAINNNLKDLQGELGDTDLSKDKLALYKAVKAAVGLTDPASTKLQQKGVNGLIKQILGTNPKFSLFQRKVLSSTVEGVGNAVITPDPALDMDHVGVPEEMAFRVFRPYVIQSMVRAGATPLQAMKEIELRSEPAKRELLRQMEQRPVLITRAPVLHKYNFLAARPVLTTGNTMRLSPSIVVGFNADFDGDQMRLHVPSSPDAVRQAYAKMLPSRNLLSAATFQTMPFIKNEFLFGLHLASKAQVDKNNVKVFRSKEDVIKAFNRGEVAPTDTVKIIG